MSDWSSFKDAKKQSDAWRNFLNESAASEEAVEIPLDEFTGGLKNFLRGKTGGS